MIIFLCGEDTYSSRRKLKKIIEHYQKTHKSGLNLRYFNGHNLDFQNFRDEFRLIPMLSEKKLMVLQNTSRNEDFKSKFLKDVKKFAQAENIILFYEETEPLADSFFDSLKRYGKWQEFPLLKGGKLRDWVKKEFARQGASIDEIVPAKLMDWVGSDLWQMSNEIKKLVNYKAGKNIEVKDVELLVKPKIETDIFKTIDAIAVKDKKTALSLIHKHLEKGDSHLYLLAMISFQFRNLLAVKSGSKLKMHPYVLRKTTQQARVFSFEELKKIYRKIFQADLDIKTGRMDSDTALDLFISGI